MPKRRYKIKAMTLASIGMMLVFAIDYPMEVAAKKAGCARANSGRLPMA